MPCARLTSTGLRFQPLNLCLQALNGFFVRCLLQLHLLFKRPHEDRIAAASFGGGRLACLLLPDRVSALQADTERIILGLLQLHLHLLKLFGIFA